MSDKERNLDWLLSTQGEFLQQFGFDQAKIIEDYDSWKIINNDSSATNFLFELLRQASLYNNRNAKTEEEFYNSKLLLDSKMLEYSSGGQTENKNYFLGQIHFDKLLISRLTLPFKFDVQIDATNCCSDCAKKDKRILTLENVLANKYLPFAKYKNEEGCCCSYSIVPLRDENGKLIPKDA